MPIKKINGKYAVDVSLGINPITQKQQRKKIKGIKTKAEAERIETELKRKYHQNNYHPNHKILFREIAFKYFSEHTEKQKKTYLIIQEGYYKNHISSYFDSAEISKIKYQNIKYFQDNLLKETNLSNSSINKIFILLKKIFDIAIFENIIASNPVEKVAKLKTIKSEMNFWTITEFKYFMNLIEENEEYLKIFYFTSFFTGLRAGEAIALKWTDIDFTRNEININKSLVFLKGEHLTTEPKTKSSIRRITINSKLSQELMQWKINQISFLANNFQNFNSENLYVFQYSEKIPSSSFFSKKIKKICSRSKTPFPSIRLHDFRHSHVALLIDNKEEPVAIKERLGHASITTTIDTYGHLYPNKQKEMSDKLDSLFN